MLIETGGWGAGGGLITVWLKSDCVNGQYCEATYLLFLFGLTYGPLPAAISSTNITINSPALLGPTPWVLQGPVTYLSASLSPIAGGGYAAIAMGMGTGKLSLKPDFIKGIDVGIDYMGGVSLLNPLANTKKPCSSND